MRGFVKVVSSLPFAGKLAIRPAMRGFLRSKLHERWKSFVWVVTVLSAMIFGHSAQAMQGIRSTIRLAAVALRFKPLWYLVFAAYTAANIAVTIVQIYLLYYCVVIYFWRQRTVMAGEHREFTLGEFLLMIGVTLGGQMLFMTGRSLLR